MEKLIRFLKAFGETEIIKLEKNLIKKDVNPTLLKIYNYLVKHHPKYEKLDEKKIAPKIKDTNGKPLIVKQLQTNASKLASSIEPFFVQQELETQPYLKERLRIAAFAKRGLFDEFQAESLQLIAQIEEGANPDSDHFYMLYKLYNDLFFHPFTEKFQHKAELLEKSKLYFKKLSLLVELRSLSESFIRQQVHELDSEPLQPDPIPSIPANYHEPIFCLYSNLLKVLQEQQPSTLMDIIKNDLNNNITALSDFDKSNITQKLIIRAYYYYERGHLEYLPYLYDLYHLGNQYNFVLYNGTLSHITYMNVVATAAGVREFKWADKFMATYRAYLNTDFAEQAHNFAMASYFFFLPDFNKTIEFLEKLLLYEHITIRLQAEMLYLKTYYELIVIDKANIEDFDKCEDRLKSYLKRNNIPLSEQREMALKNFINCLRKMINYHYLLKEKKKEAKKKLLMEFDSLLPMFSRGWMYQKIKGLK